MNNQGKEEEVPLPLSPQQELMHHISTRLINDFFPIADRLGVDYERVPKEEMLKLFELFRKREINNIQFKKALTDLIKSVK